MKIRNKMKKVLLLIFMLMSILIFGQEVSTKERFYDAKKFLREGNNAFEKGDTENALLSYQKSLAKNGSYYKGAYNLGNTFFKQKKYKEAEEYYKMANKLADTKERKAKSHEALGDNFLQQKKP